MIIIDNHIGQLCNRLWSLLPIISYSLEKNEIISIFWSPKDVEFHFHNLKQNRNLRFYFSGIKKPIWWWRIDTFIHNKNLFINVPLEQFKSKNKLIHFIDAWKHSDDISYIQNHIQEIKKLFRPNELVLNNISNALGTFNGFTIGVHIRRGDYKEYLSGRYYFSIEKWAKYIQFLSSQITDRNVRFLICSNEEGIDEELSRLLPNDIFLSIPKTNGITDLYALSKCDYLIGVPSSYSQWASFIGDVPLYLITDEKMPSLDDFHKIIYFNHFDNGCSLVLENGFYYIN